MRNAHLVERVYLVNQGTGEAARGPERLKKAPGFAKEINGEAVAEFQQARDSSTCSFLTLRASNTTNGAPEKEGI